MAANNSALRYSAFLSYSNADREWGEWLQQSLERYIVPGELVGKTTSTGEVPRSLRPVFRDRWDLSAGHSMNEMIEAALDRSRHLIVLCSPNSAKSQYVNDEIYRFKSKGAERRILAIIVGGEPGDPNRECFPEALRFNRKPGGSTVQDPDVPLAADARPEGDGKELAELKIIAGMLGVGLDEIRKREEIERQRRVRKARMIAGAMGGLALIAFASTGVAGLAYVQRGEALALAEDRRKEAEKRYDESLDSTLRFVTTSATFRTLLDDSKGTGTEFDIAQIETKGADEDFQKFLREHKTPDEIWLRLVRVLMSYEKDVPSELRRYRPDLERLGMPLKWVRHAETISRNLVTNYGDKPEYKSRA